VHDFLSRLGIEPVNSGAATTRGFLETTGPELEVHSPIDGAPIAKVRLAERAEYDVVAAEAHRVFADWRNVPAPKRGEILRDVSDALRAHKQDLGRLVTLEVGKLLSEGLGEVQESIDMADFASACPASSTGLTMHSERPGHRMYEQWHPLGVVGVITAFNFPNAVWAWNSMVAAAAGDTCVWKPSLKAPLTAIATHRICDAVFQKHGWGGVLGLVIGDDKVVGEAMIRDHRIPLISATGSCRMGRHVGSVVAERLGRALLELGGNNAIIVHEDADLDLALRAIVFGAVGTAGQRCTTTRRLLVHEKVVDPAAPRLVKAYESASRSATRSSRACWWGRSSTRTPSRMYEAAIAQAKAEGGEVLCGGAQPGSPGPLRQPTIVRANAQHDLRSARRDLRADPVRVHVRDLDRGDRPAERRAPGPVLGDLHQRVPASERFLSHTGSDCGIANVNIGTSGAEIGGAFGGEKETGGGREAGSDSWKAYMRRQTCTLNWADDLPLAQGVKFDL
jgi:aldehyde dehydrogenase (NAD+)